MNSSTRKRLFALLNKHKLTEERGNICLQITGGRTSSTKNLSEQEALQIINNLQDKEQKQQERQKRDPCDQMRKKIIAILAGTEIKMQSGEYYFLNEHSKPDMPSIYKFIALKGYLKKPLNSYNQYELPKLVTQIEQIAESYEAST